MAFYEDYKAASNDIVEYYGDTVIYSDPLVQPLPVRAIVHHERSSRRKNASGGYDMVRVRTIYLLTHGAPKVDVVREDATIEVEGTKYRIESSGGETGGRIMCKLIRAGRTEISRQRRGTL
jgi:hypothetical protein